MSIQAFGEKFDLTKLLQARDVARDITYRLAGLLQPGMTEEDAHLLYKELLGQCGVAKQWHPPKLRLGPNTIRSFREVSTPHVLQEEDIFFIDIGPVIEGHEADYGETFSIGSSYEHKKISEAAKTLFHEVTCHWEKNQVTGGPLYEYARERAVKMGYHLHMESADGHRIGDFPHHIFFKGGLAECEERIVPNAWILEIHLLEPGRKFGAFYEDLLTAPHL